MEETMQTGSTGQTATTTTARHRTSEMEECMRLCAEAAKVCLETIPLCLDAGGKHAKADHIMLLINCARICQTNAKVVLSGARQSTYTSNACAEICRECSDDCKATGNEQFMQHCADVCKRCADSCRKLAVH